MNKERIKKIIPDPILILRRNCKERIRRIFLIIISMIPSYNYYRFHTVIAINQEISRYEIVEDKKLSFSEVKKIYKKKYRRKNVLPEVNFVVGTICTLKCRDCTQWNPYLKTKKWFPANEVLADIDKMLEFIDYIPMFSLIGGETLAYPDLDIPLSYCINNSKIGYIVISTNGTVYPSEKVLELLANKKVFTIVDNYAAKDENNYNKLVDYLINNKCNYKLYGEQKFTTIGTPRTLQDISTTEKIHRFNICWLRNASEVIERVFYRCNRTHGGLDIGLFDNNAVKDDYFSFDEITNKEQMKNAIWKSYSKPYLNTCAACNSKKDRKIHDAAIQLES